MTRYLITGASSFVGKALATRLAERGAEVHVLSRPTTAPSRLPVNIPADHVHLAGDTADSVIATVAAIAPDATFHLAGHYLREPELPDVDPLIQANLTFGTLLLEGLRQAGGTRRFINTGTYARYYHEPDEAKTAVEFQPLNLYAATKQAFDTILAYYVDVEGLQAMSLVLHDTFGPGDWRRKLLPAIRAAQANDDPLALPDEDVALDLVHVEDVIAAYERADTLLCDTPAESSGSTFFVSQDRLYRISEVVALFEELGGRPIDVAWGRFELPERRVTAPFRGPVLPGWRARISVPEGIRELLGSQEASQGATQTP